MPSAPPLRYRLHDPELLRTLMRRTGDGSRVSTRTLADAAGVHYSLIGKLVLGEQETTSGDIAAAICGRLGVDLLVLWEPVERTVRARLTPTLAVVTA